jgi:DNA-binding GntR family transcriptional regulator
MIAPRFTEVNTDDAEKQMNAGSAATMANESVVENRTEPVSLTERAYRELEEQIVTLQLEPGTVLTEAALAARLDIGRTPIREALQRLAREGLVVILPRRGCLVSQIDVRRQLKLIEVRRELERLMARAAVQRKTEAERARFVEIAEGMEAAARGNDDMTFMRYDRMLNLLISTAARNEFASNAMGLMHGLSRRFWYIHYKEVADLPHCARLHSQLARAIAEGDSEAAGRSSDELLDYIEDFTRATLDAGQIR